MTGGRRRPPPEAAPVKRTEVGEAAAGLTAATRGESYASIGSTRSEISRASASEEVAAGEGALRT
jgi:hypothetical protein